MRGPALGAGPALAEQPTAMAARTGEMSECPDEE
jgi:hypothetical protein